jgi:isopentenyl-diphosphate delta-isomerase type 1
MTIEEIMITAINDEVVLLDEHDQAIGTAPRASVHGTDTPRHLAFSCYVFDNQNRVLLTRRALTKVAWPGVWTNSCCGHPRPGEAAEDAVRRRMAEELGADVTDLRLVLPDFGYRAVDASGVVENEFCPVWVARLAGSVEPDPNEVAEIAWVAWRDLVTLVDTAPALLSPWCVEQVPQLWAAESKVGAA